MGFDSIHGEIPSWCQAVGAVGTGDGIKNLSTLIEDGEEEALPLTGLVCDGLFTPL